MPGRHAPSLPGCLLTCLGILFVLMLLPAILTAVLSIMATVAVVALIPVALVLTWRSNRSPRFKRAVAGTLIPPLGAYYLFRYTRLGFAVRVAALAVAALGLALLIREPAAGVAMLIGLGAAFLVLFLGASRGATHVGGRDVGRGDLRRLLEVEEAQTATERRLLLAREFTRLAERTLATLPTDQATWPSERNLDALRAEIRVLLASATDPAAAALPETTVADPITTSQLVAALRELDSYVARLRMARATAGLDLEQLRVLTRERVRLQTTYDRVVRSIQEREPEAPGTPSSAPVAVPNTTPLPRRK